MFKDLSLLAEEFQAARSHFLQVWVMVLERRWFLCLCGEQEGGDVVGCDGMKRAGVWIVL